MKISITLICLLFMAETFGQKWAANLIADSLLKNSDAVVRQAETIFEVKNKSEAIRIDRGAITILNENGLHFANIVVPYNKFIKIKDIDAELFDKNGKSIKKLKRADIESYSSSGGANSIDDSYFKVAQIKDKEYPFTVQYQTEYVHKNMMFYPEWSAYHFDKERVAVESASFKIISPLQIPIRYQSENIMAPLIVTQEDKQSYLWEVKNLKALLDEPYSSFAEVAQARVFTAPTEFQVEDYAGKIDTWKDIAKFIIDLNKDRDKLPAAAEIKVKELVKNAKSDFEKIKILYEYMQNTTRYVSIQLGLGGWQTMTATEVVEKGYGDCKALSNYMVAMLKTVGIKANQVLIRAGDNKEPILDNFPSFQFNHVIVAVPQPKDTVWLECTSQRLPAGYLGSFTGQRKALWLNEGQSKLVETPKYLAADNLLKRKLNVSLDENFTAKATVNTHFYGEQYEDEVSLLHDMNVEQQKKYLQNNLNLPSLTINNIALSENKEKNLPLFIENLDLTIENVAIVSGSRLFIMPNFLNKLSNPVNIDQKKFDFRIKMTFLDEDEVHINLPAGYKIEYLPEPIEIKSDFGLYKASMVVKGQNLTYSRSLSMQKGVYKAELFKKYIDFRKKIAKADKSQVVLQKLP